MILKASQRGGGKQLALHLLRTDQNEHVEVHEVSGFVSDDVVGAMKEAYAVSRSTQCKQFLFSVSLNPPETERVAVETFEKAITRIEEANGLSGQPRIVVCHEKEGRRHCHAVWSRIDAETMTARPLPYFKNKLREVSKEIYLEQGWKMPRGLMDSREADPRNFTLEEWQQAKRAGLPARDLKQTIQECWAASDSRAAFAHALEERGLRLARGDRRGFVAVTTGGEALSLSRYTGQKGKQLTERLGAPEELPSVEDTKAQIAREMTPVVRAYFERAEERFAADHAPLEQERRRMAAGHRAERSRLDAAQSARWEQEAQERAQRLRTGLSGVLDRLTGRAARQRRENAREAHAALQRDREQRHRLLCAQLEERCALQERIKALRAHHTQELANLLRDLARLRRGDLEAMPQHRKGQPPPRAGPQSGLRREWKGSTQPERTRPTPARRAPALQDRLEALRSPSPEKRTERHHDR